jgi:hypothetical protein
MTKEELAESIADQAMALADQPLQRPVVVTLPDGAQVELHRFGSDFAMFGSSAELAAAARALTNAERREPGDRFVPRTIHVNGEPHVIESLAFGELAPIRPGVPRETAIVVKFRTVQRSFPQRIARPT